jgi:hypothetical protein
MFIFGEHDASGPLLIPQVSHAWLAWQIAEHWGNRRFARPAPRAEVLAAVLLHDSGWTEFDAAPTIDDEGRPHVFNRMPVVEHLNIWRSSVARAAQHSRYAGMLVAAHYASLAELKTRHLLEKGDTPGARAAESCRAELVRRHQGWRENLRGDARYEHCRGGPGWQSNSGLFALCDRVSVTLCASLPVPFEVEAPTTGGQTTTLTVTAAAAHTYRVRPWPFAGDKVRLQCEGRRVSRLTFGSVHEYREALRTSPTERLTFTLARTSVPIASDG